MTDFGGIKDSKKLILVYDLRNDEYKQKPADVHSNLY